MTRPAYAPSAPSEARRGCRDRQAPNLSTVMATVVVIAIVVVIVVIVIVLVVVVIVI